jgi:hypothetical protein
MKDYGSFRMLEFLHNRPTSSTALEGFDLQGLSLTTLVKSSIWTLPDDRSSLSSPCQNEPQDGLSA